MASGNVFSFISACADRRYELASGVHPKSRNGTGKTAPQPRHLEAFTQASLDPTFPHFDEAPHAHRRGVGICLSHTYRTPGYAALLGTSRSSFSRPAQGAGEGAIQAVALPCHYRGADSPFRGERSWLRLRWPFATIRRPSV